MTEDWIGFGEEETLYYSIPKRPVYYMCLNCGHIVRKEELESMPSMICPRCAYRIFVKIRSPGQGGVLRRIKAV